MQTWARSQDCTGPQAVPSEAGARMQPTAGSHTPSWHLPSPGHGGAGRCSQPVLALHTSTVQAFWSSHERGTPTQRQGLEPIIHIKLGQRVVHRRDIGRELQLFEQARLGLERLRAVVDAVKDIKWRSIDKDNMEFATTCFVVDRIRIALAALEQDDD